MLPLNKAASAVRLEVSEYGTGRASVNALGMREQGARNPNWRASRD